MQSDEHKRRSLPLPPLKIVLSVYGAVGLIVLMMFIAADQRDKAINPDCTDAQVEIDLSTVAPESDLQLLTRVGGMCVGDVIYEGPELCKDGITLFESVTDDPGQDSVQFRIVDCELSVEKITRR